MEKAILIIIVILTFALDSNECSSSFSTVRLKNLTSVNSAETIGMKDIHLLKKRYDYLITQQKTRIIYNKEKIKSVAYRLLVRYGK
jgi:hypothetical protein